MFGVAAQAAPFARAPWILYSASDGKSCAGAGQLHGRVHGQLHFTFRPKTIHLRVMLTGMTGKWKYRALLTRVESTGSLVKSIVSE